MSKPKKSVIEVRGAAITIVSQKEQDFISLTDIARFKSADRFDDLIRNWLRNRNTVEFLGVWERLKRLNQIAIRQMQVLTSANLKTLPGAKEK